MNNRYFCVCLMFSDQSRSTKKWDAEKINWMFHNRKQIDDIVVTSNTENLNIEICNVAMFWQLCQVSLRTQRTWHWRLVALLNWSVQQMAALLRPSRGLRMAAVWLQEVASLSRRQVSTWDTHPVDKKANILSFSYQSSLQLSTERAG